MEKKFLNIKNDILGKKYSLSIVFVDQEKSRELNKKYRNKDKATNVLSFALRKNMGELVLCSDVIKKEAASKKFGRDFDELVGFLVIHGMLHLKGLEHSSRMEEAEEKYDKKYFSRNRRGLLDDQGHRGRILQRRKKS
jgi:probable rRNA maturation factor